MYKINIDYNQVVKLYINKNLSRKDVANKLGISITTLKRFISKYNLHKSQDEIQKQRERTNIKLFGTKTLFENPIIKTHIKETNIKKYGTDNPAKSDIIRNKISKTLQNKNSKFFEDRELKRKNTCIERYGVDSNMKSPAIKNKLYINLATNAGFTENLIEEGKKLKLIKEHATKTKNKSFNISHVEDKIYNLLCTKYENVIRQYKSELYPYACDFYIKKLNLYIEYQGHWTHGGHPFKINDPLDMNKLNLWKNKNNEFYKVAIKTWTIRDTQKRNLAKTNNLNWLEFFTFNEFLEWFNR